MKTVAALILTTAALLLLSACAAAAPAPHHPTAAKQPDTCGQFLKLSPAQRAKAYAAEKKVDFYTVDGVRKVTLDVVYAADCPSHAAADLVGNAIEGEFPDCAPFAQLTPAVAAQWVTEANADPANRVQHKPTAAQYGTLCAAFGHGWNLIAVGNLLAREGFVSNDAVVAWTTETRLGYTEQLGIGLKPLQKGAAISDDLEKKAIATCDFDSSTDAVVPIYLSVDDTTKDKQPRLAAAFSLSASDGGLSTARIAATYTSGPSCTSAATRFAPARVSVTFEGKAKSQVDGSEVTTWSAASEYWVVLKNYFSPRYPGGAKAELSGYLIQGGTNSVSTDDPVVSSTAASISLAPAIG